VTVTLVRLAWHRGLARKPDRSGTFATIGKLVLIFVHHGSWEPEGASTSAVARDTWRSYSLVDSV
jgi:hypothetical protein